MGILDSLSKNPSLIALAALGIGLFIFRDKISGFFSDISGGAQATAKVGETTNLLLENLLGNLTGTQNLLTDLNKSISNFQFPNPFEGLDLSKIFGGNGDSAPVIIRGEGGNVPPDLMCECGTNISQDASGVVTTSCIPCSGGGTPAPPFRDAEIFAKDFPETFVPITPTTENFNVQTGLFTDEQQFFGGGPSFIGGSVSEIPIERLGLGGIIDRLGDQGVDISASRAADILARAQDNFGDFDFGTNTGGGGGPSGFAILNPGGGETSNEAFSGLTPAEIALRLTGGIISNF